MITKHNRAWVFVCLGAASLVPELAFAQAYINTTRSEPYTQLTSIPGITGVTTLTFSSADDGSAAVTLPFTFNYLGTDMTRVALGSNGFMTLGTAATIDAATSLTNQAPGTGSAPNNWIAPMWDDLLHPSAANARWGVIGTAPNRIFVIEGGPCARYSSTGGTLMYQIWLYEGSSRKFEYRATGNPVSALNSTIGYEGPAGVPNANPLGCGASCSATSGWDGVVFSTFVATEPELTGSFGAFPRGALPGGSANIDINLRNLGVDTASAVSGTIYLSTDMTLDAGDIAIGSLVPMDVIGGSINVPQTVPITVPGGTAAADFFLIMAVDSANAFMENNESDNNVIAATRFATAYDIRPSDISLVGAQGGQPGDSLTFAVTLTTDGVPYSGPLDLEMALSLDQIVDSNDPHIGVATVNVTGASPETVNVIVTLPLTLAPGRYYPIAISDSTALITELNEINNTFVGATSFQVGYDFSIASVTAPTQIAPMTSASVTTRIASNAAPYTGPITYRLFASADSVYDTMDAPLGTFTANFAGQAAIDDVQTVTPPALAAGRYYVIATIDPANLLRELNEANNETASTGPFINAPDFAVAGVTVTPASIEAGQTLTVSGSIQSLGLTFTGNVPYRVYFSPDNMFDGADEPIFDGTLFVAGLNSTSFNAAFAIPNNVPVRTFYAIVVADPDNATPEANETNNSGASSATFSIRGSDLQVEELVTAGTAFIGLPFSVTVSIKNDGIADAHDFYYAYYLSTNEIIRFTDQQLNVFGPISVPAGATQTYNDTLMLPTFTATQSLWLGVILDIYSDVPEDSEGNNSGRTDGPLSIVFPIPDLTGQIVETATAGAAGEQLSVTRVILNSGVADAPMFSYTYYLSSNPTISRDDIEVGTFTAQLAMGEDDFGFDVLTIPSDVPAGTYYLGMLIDSGDQLVEVDENNNLVVGPQIPIYSAAIQFLTQSLPDATLGANYQVGVYASGGPVGITWSVRSGTMPMGVNIDPAAGIISGTPMEEGLFPFVLRASSGTAYADQAFTIRVLSPTIPIRIASTTLETAIVGREYTTQIVAVGGTVPYDWSAVSAIPAGLTLSSSGVLSGTPSGQGNNRITVRVRDSIGGTASKELALNVINPNQKLVISQVVLPTAVVGLDYCGQDQIAFEATGGVPPYSWSAVGETPAGMVLGSDGTLCGTPEQTGSFAVTVRVQDQSGLFDTSLFILDVDDGRELAIATFSLDKGQLNTAYDGTITAVRGDAPYEWSVVPFSGELPPGLSLNSTTGHVTGTPTQAGVFAFTVQVIDAKHRSDVQPLSIEIAEPITDMLPTDDGCGCTSVEDRSSTGSMSLALFGVLGVALAFRTRRTRAGGQRRRLSSLAGALVLAIAMPSIASAQLVPGTPYNKTVSPITYTPLSSPNVIFTAGDDSNVDVTLPFPFRYYDADVTVASVGTNGALSFVAGTYISLGNDAMGTGFTPNSMIAPFWDDQQLFSATDHYIGTQTEGVAPNRTFTIEWHNLSRYASSGVTFSMMVRLFEGPAARLQVDYGPMSGSASFSSTMGMEDQAGARPILFAASNCTTSCTQTDFTNMTNQRIDLVQDPGIELIAYSITAPQFGFLGASMPVTAQLGNLHGTVIGPFEVQVVASNTNDLSNPVVVHTSQLTLNAFQTATVTLDAVPPASIGEGLYYLGLVIDPSNGVMEVNEANNVATSATQVRVREGQADLSIERVATDITSADAGDNIPLVVRVTNVGGLPANNATIALMLSTNPVASPQDVQLGTFTVSLNPGESDDATHMVTLPSMTNSGTYYLGALADPADTILELSESNNGRTASTPIAIAGGTLSITTTTLPVGLVRTTYTGLLTAVGGDTTRTWRVSAGQLPSGIGLVPSSGELFGRPMRVESQTFTVEVTSGMQTDSQQLTMMVISPEEPLTVVTREIPTGVVGQEYSFELVATGQAQGSTLAWSGSNLPQGMEVSPDGWIMGTPTDTGTAAITVSVTDGAENAIRDLELHIRANDNLLIESTPLPHGQFGVPYSQQLEANGGLRPLTWLIQVGTLPIGVDLSTNGELSGTPMQVGTFRFIVEARDAGMPGRQAKDVNTFELVVEDVAGFSIETNTLPDATVEEGYDQTIRTTGGAAPIAWTIEEGALPDGLVGSVNTTSNEFRIAGQPNAVGTSNVLLRAEDSQGRVAMRALAIRVLPKPPVLMMTTDEGGCGCSSTGSSSNGLEVALFAMLGLVLVARRSRR